MRIESYVAPWGEAFDNVQVVVGRYAGDIPAVQLTTEFGEPLLTATVNLVEYGIVPEPGNVIIKDYAEGEGTYAALKIAGVVGDAVREHTFGYDCTAVEAPLLVPREEWS